MISIFEQRAIQREKKEHKDIKLYGTKDKVDFIFILERSTFFISLTKQKNCIRIKLRDIS